jgi:hypothetical protein
VALPSICQLRLSPAARASSRGVLTLSLSWTATIGGRLEHNASADAGITSLSCGPRLTYSIVAVSSCFSGDLESGPIGWKQDIRCLAPASHEAVDDSHPASFLYFDLRVSPRFHLRKHTAIAIRAPIPQNSDAALL